MTELEVTRRIAKALFYIQRMNPGGRVWSQVPKIEKNRYQWAAEAIVQACAGSGNAIGLVERMENIASALR